MTLVLGHADVSDLCDVRRLVDLIDEGFGDQAAGAVVQPERVSLAMGIGNFRLMPVVLDARGLFGFKAFHWSAGGARYLVALYSQESGELLALVDGDHLTAIRTGATAAVAARHLARPDATTVGVIGAGAEARTNLAAMATVRDLSAVRVFSPRPHRREAFAEEMASQLGVAVTPCPSAQECVAGVDIVITATNTGSAPDPIAYRGAWAEPGQHISSIGSTLPTLRELDVETFARADLVVVDAPEQMEAECGDVVAAAAAGCYPQPASLAAVVGGEHPGRPGAEAVTLFKSVGTAMQDVLAASVVYEGAVAAGRGTSVDFLSVKPVTT